MTAKELELVSFLQYLNAHPLIAILFAFLAVWTIVWKGIALWKAAQNNSKPWFVVLLIFNTVGILEIIYIFFFSKNKNNSVA